MVARCHDPKADEYKNYGARGIYVCQRWREFPNFYADMGDPPEGKSLERINNDGPYEPGNVRWATAREQLFNTRRTHRVTFQGVTRSLTDWAERLDISVKTLRSRFRYGWSVERAFAEALKTP